MRTLKRHADSSAQRQAQVLARSMEREGRPRRRAPRGPAFGTYTINSDDPKVAPVTITAAAEVVYGKNVAKSKKRPPLAAWQREAWELRSEIPEFRFSGDRVARGCSRYKVFIAKRPDTPGGEPIRVIDGRIAELDELLFGDLPATQHGLYNAARHLTFNGETLLVVSDTDTGYEWKPRSVSELTGQGKSWKRNNGIESTNLNIDRDRVIRCWRPDPEFSGLADCPAKAVMPVARTLRGLGRRTAAEIDSRLAGAGLVLFPDDATVMDGQGTTSIAESIFQSMTIPIQDPESAAAVVPLLLQMRGEHIDKVKHISFSTPLDEKLPEMESNAIRRIGLGMDSPPETLLGLGSSNHWSGWMITSEEVTLVLSPTVATICHSLTTGFLHELLETEGIPDASDYMVWFDASELELRPDKSTDSRDLHSKDVLSDEAMLRENGFSKDDMPDDAEKKRRLLERLVVADPSLAPTILPELGIELDFQAWTGGTPTSPGTDPDGDKTDEHPVGEHEPPVRPTDPPDDTIETGPGQ